MSTPKSASHTGPVRIGLDLGGTKILAKVFTESYEALGKAKTKTEGHRGVKSGLKRMVLTIEEALEEAGVSADQITSIGVGCPGPVNPRTGVLIEAPNLGWKNVPITEHFSKAFGGVPTVICNDVDAGIYAEYEMGAGKSSDCVVGIFPGTGIGAGAVVGGQLLQGAKLSCMELGHIPLGLNGSSLETECSRLKIAIESARAAYRGLAPHLLKTCGTDISKITSGKLADSIANGDLAIKEIVVTAAKTLGVGVATVVHLLAPDKIILGGGLVEALPDLFVKHVRKSANAHLIETYRDSFKIVAAELEDDAGVMGAAAWAARKSSQ